MELQEIFDTVVNHLRQQGKRAETFKDGRCVYRSPEGLKCAVGCLISDEEYRPELEGTAVGALVISGNSEYVPSLHQKLNTHAKLELARKLQNVHDNVHLDDWEHRFQTTAKMFDLTYTPPVKNEIL